jgi:hypothetical protein
VLQTFDRGCGQALWDLKARLLHAALLDLFGVAGMGKTAGNSVVDGSCRSHNNANLW